MPQYRSPDEPASGPFGFFKDKDEDQVGGEVLNFLPQEDGYVYGYAPVLSRNNDVHYYSNLAIEKLGARQNDNRIDNVTVIFFANTPRFIEPYDNKSRIVGWYKNATVYRKAQKNEYINSPRVIPSDTFYYAKTAFRYAFCVPENQRTFEIPSRYQIDGGYGQRNVWYADSNHRGMKKFLTNVIDYIDTSELKFQTKISKTANRQLDYDKRKKIEISAVSSVTDHFKALGYKVKSVEQEAKGWDLECTNGTTTLFVEVKGTQGLNFLFELTPNEYTKMIRHYKKYMIAVVLDCLGKPEPHIFTIISDGKDFTGFEYSTKLKIYFQDKVGAIGKLKTEYFYP